MGGPRIFLSALVLAWLTAACTDKQGDLPTNPSFAPPGQTGCSANAVSDLVKNEFGASSDESGLATDMKNYGAKSAQATYVGYQLLDAIATKYEISANQAGSRLNASNLAIALLKCMNTGTADADLPASFEVELGPTGAFAVPALAGGGATVMSHNGTWVLEPPAGQTWEAITQLAVTGLPDSVDHLFLTYGKPGSTTGFTNDQLVLNDQLVGTVFNWNTIPEATFSGIGVVVGECTLPPNYIQHNAENDVLEDPEVLGYIPPSCAEFEDFANEREPRTFAERLVRWLGPPPAFAALATTVGSGGGKNKLSPFGLIFPGVVNLDPQFTWTTKKSGYTVGKPFAPKPVYEILSAAHTEFEQDFVLIWLESIGNNGANVDICNNWAYTNADGIAQFPAAFLNKAGGYTIIARTTGTVSKPDAELGEAPSVPPGASVPSPLINVKNGALGVCTNVYHAGDPPPDPINGPNPNGFAPLQ